MTTVVKTTIDSDRASMPFPSTEEEENRLARADMRRLYEGLEGLQKRHKPIDWAHVCRQSLAISSGASPAAALVAEFWASFRLPRCN